MGAWDLANGLNAAASRKALEKIAEQYESARAVAYTNGWRDGWAAGYAAAKQEEARGEKGS